MPQQFQTIATATTEHAHMRVQRSAMLFRAAPIAITISLVIALIAAWAAWPHVDHSIIFAWLGALAGLAGIRAFNWIRLSRKKLSERRLKNFERFHIMAMALNGVLWGSLVPIFAAYGILGNAFLPFIVAGMTAAAVVSAGASWKAVVAFNFPLLAPVIVIYLMAGTRDGLAIALVVLIYAIGTGVLAFSMQNLIERALMVKAKSKSLVGRLEEERIEATEASRMYRALIEESQDITIIFTPDGRISYVSPSAQRVFGAAPGGMIGLTTREILHPNDYPGFREVGGKALLGLGEVHSIGHVCMRAPDQDFVQLSGRITNMMYAPGVEGFVFSGGPARGQACRIQAAE